MMQLDNKKQLMEDLNLSIYSDEAKEINKMIWKNGPKRILDNEHVIENRKKRFDETNENLQREQVDSDKKVNAKMAADIDQKER